MASAQPQGTSQACESPATAAAPPGVGSARVAEQCAGWPAGLAARIHCLPKVGFGRGPGAQRGARWYASLAADTLHGCGASGRDGPVELVGGGGSADLAAAAAAVLEEDGLGCVAGLRTGVGAEGRAELRVTVTRSAAFAERYAARCAEEDTPALTLAGKRRPRAMLYAKGAEDLILTDAEVRKALRGVFRRLGERRRVLALPPDMTRANSRAGPITCMVEEYYKDRLANVMPALGTHVAMPDWQLEKMFPTVPKEKICVHDWRNDVTTIGHVPREYVSEVTGGVYEACGLQSPLWKCQLNRLVWEGDHDLVLSIGQVVPHEVIGMANYTKNVFVGTGGKDGINESHFIGAAYGMEKMMGRADTPVRRIMNTAYDRFALSLPLLFILTVIGKDEKSGELVIRGLYVGDDHNCFEEASKLALRCNFVLVDEQPKKVVVYLDPEEFHTTWLGNKAVYRTRMLIATDGELVILAPAVAGFGEDDAIDVLIRKYGYRTTPEVLKFVKENEDLAANLSAAAHLIHGSSEGRFKVTYCTPKLTREEVEGVGFSYGDLAEMSQRYDPQKLKDGWNDVDGERVWYVSNPALGLWAWKGRFEDVS